MDLKKILGILFIILGVIFIAYPMCSLEAISIFVGVSLIVFGCAEIFNAFNLWSVMTHISGIRILLGILAILCGLLFFNDLGLLAFLASFQFYLIAFVMIFVGILGLAYGTKISRIASALILIMGIITIFLAVYAIASPTYIAILVGVCLIMEGISLFLE